MERTEMFSSEKPLPKPLYVLGVAVIFLAVYSQYFIDFSAIAGGTYATAIGFLVVYGIPILVVSSFFGRQLLQRAAKNNKTAIKYGLGAFGALTVLGIFLEVVALSIILIFQPQAANLLNRPNPVLEVPPNVALIIK